MTSARCSIPTPGCRPRVGLDTRPELAATASRPLLIAHRGAHRADLPENTVPAALAALGHGADGVEVDVRLSSDGQIMCSHDADLQRIAGSPLTVAGTPASVLRSVPLPGGHRLAVLDELLDTIAARGRYRLIVEAKPVADEIGARRLADELAAVLSRADRLLEVTVSSFDAALLARVRSATTGIHLRTALLGAPTDSAANLLQHATEGCHDEVHPHVTSLLCAPHVVAVAASRAIGVTCWTVNSGRHLRRLTALSVDAVITDDILAARRALQADERLPAAADLMSA
jgi:glycerophosphoryl diester phosphodiesterase